MAEMWYPLATKDEFKDAGGFLDGYKWRGVLHTTEGSTYAGARPSYVKGNAPHFTVSFEGGVFKVWQHIPINKAARALSNPAGGVETNRGRAVQVEIVGRAADSHALNREYLNGIGRLMRWIEGNTGIQRTAPDFKGSGEGIVLAVASSPIRLKGAAWINFNGWCGHQHVPENAHWDPGNIDIEYLLKFEAGVRPMIDPPLDMNNVVHVARDIYTNGVYILQEDGAIFAFEGAVYYGGANGKWYFPEGTHKAARIVWPEEYMKITGATSDQYKYHIQATNGDFFGYPE